MQRVAQIVQYELQIPEKILKKFIARLKTEKHEERKTMNQKYISYNISD